jgi:proline iminopeptidase
MVADDPRYPPIEPWWRGRLEVGDGHDLAIEQSGRPDGVPVVFIHGGPGGRSRPDDRRWFDPAAYRIILFDQRGAGASTPAGSVEGNTTWHLVRDLEHIREHLRIPRWHIFGGSWGTTLALAYAQRHPTRVLSLVLRGVFLGRRWELQWLYQHGANVVFPDLYEELLDAVRASGADPEAGVVDACAGVLLGDGPPDVRQRLGRAWTLWEHRTRRLVPDLETHDDDEALVRIATIEAHYFSNGCFLDPEDQLLRDVEHIRHIPATIVQGRYDMVCPFRSAWDLHRSWPEAEFVVVHDAGHAFEEPGTTRALVAATDRYREEGSWSSDRA